MKGTADTLVACRIPAATMRCGIPALQDAVPAAPLLFSLCLLVPLCGYLMVCARG